MSNCLVLKARVCTQQVHLISSLMVTKGICLGSDLVRSSILCFLEGSFGVYKKNEKSI